MLGYTILALDASSTKIGYVYWDGSVLSRGTIDLPGKLPIEERCQRAYGWIDDIVRFRRPDVVAIESPVARFAKALIPQARVSGAIMAICALRKLLVHEITPAEAKMALTGKGNADKIAMMDAAVAYGISGDEHQADALGIALAASKVVKLVRKAA